MQFKVIDNDKVKILVESKDFDNFPELDECRSGEVKEFILNLLDKIYVSTGVNFLGSKIFVEVISGGELSFYVVVTRLHDKTATGNIQTVKADEDMYLFELYFPECIFDVSQTIRNAKKLKTGTSRMYKYKEKYYLCINFPPQTVSDPDFYSLINSITCHSKKCKWNLLNEAFLCEWGELIIENPLVKLNI